MVIKTTWCSNLLFGRKLKEKAKHYLGNLDWHANLGWHGNLDYMMSLAALLGLLCGYGAVS